MSQHSSLYYGNMDWRLNNFHLCSRIDECKIQLMEAVVLPAMEDVHKLKALVIKKNTTRAELDAYMVALTCIMVSSLR